jgi:hypothetical protein
MGKSIEDPTSVDQLPDNPLSMPPPYWRSSGATFHIDASLTKLERLLKRLLPMKEKVDAGLLAFYQKYRTKAAREAADDDNWKIYSPLARLELEVKLTGEVACLMSAIAAEDNLNYFCVFNLHRNIAESIEKLSTPEKLLVACTVTGTQDVKGTSAYEAAKKLSAWRNAFAHGHCVDRPTKSLRHNHLISPAEYPGIPSATRDTVAMVSAYLTLSDYLRLNSQNQFLRGKSGDDEDIRRSVRRLSVYTFQGTNWHYTIRVNKSY